MVVEGSFQAGNDAIREEFDAFLNFWTRHAYKDSE
jgi:hypothetical protein